MGAAFPEGKFPLGMTHEIVSPTATCAATANGFIAGLLSSLLTGHAYILWVSTKRSVFPAGLRTFALNPEQIIFVDVDNDTEALWVMESALKCSALTAVVGGVQEISFTQSQRLQLAVERSGLRVLFIADVPGGCRP